MTLHELTQEFRTDIVLRTIRATNLNMAEAARQLGMSSRNLYHTMTTLGIPRKNQLKKVLDQEIHRIEVARRTRNPNTVMEVIRRLEEESKPEAPVKKTDGEIVLPFGAAQANR